LYTWIVIDLFVQFRTGTFQKNANVPHARKLYKNGIMIASDAPNVHLVVNSKISIGAVSDSSAPGFTTDSFYGDIDELYIYTAALISTNVYNLYHSHIIPIGPSIYIPFTQATIGAAGGSIYVNDYSIRDHFFSTPNHLIVPTSNPPIFQQDASLCQNNCDDGNL
jgi:hypothetical protein